jgi:hypothetical protein
MTQGKITISRIQSNQENYLPIKITIDDVNAVTQFLEIEMSLEDFAECLTGLAARPCVFDARGLERIGKKREMQDFIFELPDGTMFGSKTKEIATELAIKLSPIGWEVSTYFNSQNSFFKENGKEWARTHILRWVD